MRGFSSPDLRPEQTDDDCEWLNEEDGEEDVPGNVRERDRRGDAPTITADQCWNRQRQHGAGPGCLDRVRRCECRCGLAGILRFSGGAAAVGFSLGEDTSAAGAVRVLAVHRAVSAVCAAGHARFGSGQPAGAHCRVAGEDAETQKDGRQPLDQSHCNQECWSVSAMSNVIRLDLAPLSFPQHGRRIVLGATGSPDDIRRRRGQH